MAHFFNLLLSAASCLTLASTVAAEDVLISERHQLSRRFIDAQGNYNISFYHVNDVHAHLDEFSAAGTDCEDQAKGCYGGYSRIRTELKESRPSHKDSLFLSVGDEFQGTMFFSYYEGGWKVSEAMNMMGFDAMTLGNHEFDKGSQHLGEFINNLTFPVVSANVVSTNPILNQTVKPFEYFPQYDLAVIGVTTDTTPSTSSPGDETNFTDPIKAVQDTVNHIRATTNIKRIAALTHIGYDEDQRLARETTGLYLIMGGHSHTLLGSMANAEGTYPTIVKNKEDEEVFIVSAHRWGEYLGYIDVTYDPEGRILAYHGAPIRMTNTTKPDPEFQAHVDEWRIPFEEHSRQEIGVSNVVLDQTTCQTAECLLGNFICDAMLDSRVKKTLPGDPLPAFAFTNAGGIRASINEGSITRGEVLTSFPFGNEMVEIMLTGQEIWDIFEGIVARKNKNTGAKVTSFVQVSKGVQVRWHARDEKENPSIGELASFSIDHKPLEWDKVYKVVTIDFLANGGDNIIRPKIPSAGIDKLDEVLSKYIEAQSPINIHLEQRLKPIGMCRPRPGGSGRRKRSNL